jgi:hypothetical protein
LRLRVQGSEVEVQGLEFEVRDLEFELQGSGFRVQGLGFEVQMIHTHRRTSPWRAPEKVTGSYAALKSNAASGAAAGYLEFKARGSR